MYMDDSIILENFQYFVYSFICDSTNVFEFHTQCNLCTLTTYDIF